jgi:hypothetical protein
LLDKDDAEDGKDDPHDAGRHEVAPGSHGMSQSSTLSGRSGHPFDRRDINTRNILVS